MKHGDLVVLMVIKQIEAGTLIILDNYYYFKIYIHVVLFCVSILQIFESNIWPIKIFRDFYRKMVDNFFSQSEIVLNISVKIHIVFTSR